jgi:hypothetical protein
MDVTPVKNQLIDDNYENSIVVNRIGCADARSYKENLDRDFGQMWQATLWGGSVPKKAPEDTYTPYKTGRSSTAFSQSSKASRASKSINQNQRKQNKQTMGSKLSSKLSKSSKKLPG